MNLTRSCSTEPVTQTEVSLNVYIGTTFKITVTFYQDDGTTPLDLTLNEVEFNIVNCENEEIISINSSTTTANGSTIVFVDAINGIAEITITDEETLTFSKMKGYWWMTLNLPSGDKLLRGRGNIFIKNPYE